MNIVREQKVKEKRELKKQISTMERELNLSLVKQKILKNEIENLKLQIKLIDIDIIMSV